MVRSGAEVIELAPRWSRRTTSAVVDTATKPIRMLPRSTVDEWGRDARLVDAIAPWAHLRWDFDVHGEGNVSAGGALVVVNARQFALTPISAALALGKALDRPVRFAGRPDIVPFGPMLRRIGGLLALRDEIAGALRYGSIVVLGTSGTASPKRAGVVDSHLLGAAVSEKVPVHVAAVSNPMLSRQARLEITPPLRPDKVRRGPLAEVELAELAQQRLQELLDVDGGR